MVHNPNINLLLNNKNQESVPATGGTTEHTAAHQVYNPLDYMTNNHHHQHGQAKSKTSKTQSIPKLADDTKYKLAEEFNKKPVVNAKQERMNKTLVNMVRYAHRPLPISKNNHIPIYRPQTTTTSATNENKLGIESTNKSPDTLTTNPSIAQSLVD
jgi:hypothetical protein